MHNYHVEAKFDQFCQFFHNGTTLKNEKKHQSFGMKFEDRIFIHNNCLALSFRKALSSESDKVAELPEEACAEVLDKEFIHIFALSAQDLAARKVGAELNVEKLECDMH